LPGRSQTRFAREVERSKKRHQSNYGGGCDPKAGRADAAIRSL